MVIVLVCLMMLLLKCLLRLLKSQRLQHFQEVLCFYYNVCAASHTFSYTEELKPIKTKLKLNIYNNKIYTKISKPTLALRGQTGT